MIPISNSALTSAESLESCVAWTNEMHPDARMRFNVSIPANLILAHADPRTPGSKLLGVNLARLIAPPNQPSLELIVQASWVQDEFSLRDYYKHWAKLDDETLISTRPWGSDSDQTELLTSRKLDDEHCWLTRRRGFKVGNGHAGFIITINCACEVEQYEQQQPVIDAILESFQLLTTPVHPYSEPLRLVAHSAPMDFASYLPIAWKEQPHPHPMPSPTRFAFLRELQGIKSGVFTIVVADKKEFPKREEFLHEAVSTWTPLGIEAQTIVLEPTSNLGQAPTVRGTLALAARDGSKPHVYALEMLLAEFDSHWLHAEVIGPSAEENFEAWAINDRTLDLFIRHFRLPPT